MEDGTARAIVDLNTDGDWVDEDGTILDKDEFCYDSNKVIPSLMGIKPGTGAVVMSVPGIPIAAACGP